MVHLQLLSQLHTFHCRLCHGPHHDHLLVDHGDQHSRKFHPRLGVNVYVMNDATNGHHATHDHGHDHDAYDARMYEVNVVDGLDDDFVLDVDIFHRQSGSRRRNGDDIDCYTTEVLLLFFVIVLIVDLI